jgi:hypothetical protein
VKTPHKHTQTLKRKGTTGYNGSRQANKQQKKDSSKAKPSKAKSKAKQKKSKAKQSQASM